MKRDEKKTTHAGFGLGTVITIGLARLTWRFWTGAHLDGVVRTDAGVFAWGTTSFAIDRRVNRWAFLPRALRACIRVAALVLPPVLVWAWLVHPTATIALLVAVPALLAARRARTAVRRGQSRRFRATFVEPLAAAAGPVLGLEHVPADRWLTVDPAMGELAAQLQGEMTPLEVKVRAFYGQHIEPALRWLPERVQRVRWWLAPYLAWLTATVELVTHRQAEQPPSVEIRAGAWVAPEQRAILRQMVPAKLGMSDLADSWDSVGPQTVARWVVVERPPTSVSLADIADIIDTLPDHEFVWGLTAGRKPFIGSVDDDSPHIACSAGSGAGKTVFAMLTGVQVVRRGGRVFIFDLKGSHRWARGIEGIVYCTTPAQMHAAMLELGALADERNRRAFDEEDGWDPGPRNLLIFEEMNATVARMKAWWEANREKDDPKFSPAIQAFRDLTFMGRSAKTNVFGVAQMLTANTTGGPESRENFGIRALARYSKNNWKMLVPECAMPRSVRTRGRWQIAIAGEVTAVQVAFLTTAEARSLAIPPTRVQEPSAAPGAPVEAPAAQEAGPGVPASQAPAQRRSDQEGPDSSSRDIDLTETGPADPLAELVTLREAVERGLVDGLEGAVKKRMQRSEKAPEVRGKRGAANLYRTGDLIEWSMVKN